MLDIPIIDTHLHIWDIDRLDYPWMRDVPALKRTFTIADYRELHARALQRLHGQGGTISVVGIYEKPLEKLDLGMAVVRDLTLCCSVASPNAFEQTMRLMADGRLNVKPLVTHHVPLAEAPRAFELQQASTEKIKIHLTPPQEE